MSNAVVVQGIGSDVQLSHIQMGQGREKKEVPGIRLFFLKEKKKQLINLPNTSYLQSDEVMD